MDEQRYKDLIQFLETLSYLNGYNNLRKNRLRKDLTQYFSKNHTLYKHTKME